MNRLKFETQWLNNQRVKVATYFTKNGFDLAGIKQTLEREGFTVTPYRNKSDSQGYLTKEVWLYRAHSKTHNKIVWIYA